MNERAPLPVSQSSEFATSKPTRQEELTAFIIGAIEDRMWDILPEARKEELERKGVTGDPAFDEINELLHGIAKSERSDFTQVLTSIITDPHVALPTKERLVTFCLHPGFPSVVESVQQLKQSPEGTDNPVFLQYLATYNFFSKLRKHIPKTPHHKRLPAKTYGLLAHEKEFYPKFRRIVLNKWVIELDPEYEQYRFFRVGRPLHEQTEQVRIELPLKNTEQETMNQAIVVSWYRESDKDKKQPLRLLNKFWKTMRQKEHELGLKPVASSTAPGLYLQPDASPLFPTVYIAPHTDLSDFTPEELKKALKSSPNFINYDVRECILTVVTPAGNCLSFSPYIGDDPIRHPVSPAYPKKSQFSASLHHKELLDCLAPILHSTGHNEFPFAYVQQLVSGELYAYAEQLSEQKLPEKTE
jgi:hypothetical protein